MYVMYVCVGDVYLFLKPYFLRVVSPLSDTFLHSHSHVDNQHTGVIQVLRTSCTVVHLHHFYFIFSSFFSPASACIV